jgi:serine/threonine-protein kinase
LLTGTNVFTADSVVALILKHVNDPPPPMRQVSELDIPEDVESLIMACLAKSPEERPASAPELAQRIARVQEQVGEWTPQQAQDWWNLHLADLVQVPRALRPQPLHVEQETE